MLKTRNHAAFVTTCACTFWPLNRTQLEGTASEPLLQLTEVDDGTIMDACGVPRPASLPRCVLSVTDAGRRACFLQRRLRQTLLLKTSQPLQQHRLDASQGTRLGKRPPCCVLRAACCAEPSAQPRPGPALRSSSSAAARPVRSPTSPVPVLVPPRPSSSLLDALSCACRVSSLPPSPS